jgi:uncharacterized membrane protein YhhN
MVLTVLFWICLVLAVTDWMATDQGWKRVRWVTRPGTLVALILWFTQVGHWTGPLAAVGLGLVFSLVGEIFFMLPRRFFLAGMGAFALTLLFYISAFNQLPLAMRWETALPALTVGGAFSVLNRRIGMGIRRQRETELLVPVVAYAILMDLMLLAALTTLMRSGWVPIGAIMVSIGGALFFLSNSLMAYNRFVRLWPNFEVYTMIAFHLAQILIAGGVLEQFLMM